MKKPAKLTTFQSDVMKPLSRSVSTKLILGMVSHSKSCRWRKSANQAR
ncbi:hypothetical protein O9992_27985 [Vibrio lentus]|nr:hypothetical protein [Vibrio lentus]